jgi:hypothetical protein
MKPLLLFCFIITFAERSSAQITRGSWLVGGTGFFKSSKNNSNTFPNYSTTDLQFYPDFGYFIADKFATGLKLGFGTQRYKSPDDSFIGKHTNHSFGPWLRYYVLPVKGSVNLLVDGSYQYGIVKQNRSKAGINTLSFAAGPALFFNPNVAMELLVGYATTNYVTEDVGHNQLNVGLGLQVHLRKKK